MRFMYLLKYIYILYFPQLRKVSFYCMLMITKDKLRNVNTLSYLMGYHIVARR